MTIASVDILENEIGNKLGQAYRVSKGGHACIEMVIACTWENGKKLVEKGGCSGDGFGG